ncbi:hypothetical protein [Mycolicibacterium houstonense]|uniref:hypothetical protein n=1 Tax=Mycolicibacterium houstonense TaxID=146021 RepID=UPI00082D2FB3|nr:hypothetical protein [Mycolicibacterium houstonense]
MSKKKQKTVSSVAVAVKTAEVSRKLDEIIDLLHVLVHQTNPVQGKPPRYDINVSSVREAEEARDRAAALMRLDWAGDRRAPGKKPETAQDVETLKDGLGNPLRVRRTPVTIAAEEVEDYHGKAAQWPDPYLPVRMHP